MKRTMTAVLAAGTIGASSVAFADTTIYGSVRSGIIYQGSDGGTKADWDLGSVDARDLPGTAGDKLYSRIGVKSSHDLDSGMTAGLHIERRLDDFRTRHQNVWLSGTFGKLTLGQQGTVYHPARSWDGTYFYGGFGDGSVGSRAQGVKYSSTLDGPFNFSAMISDDNSVGNGQGGGLDIVEVAGVVSLAGVANFSLGYRAEDDGAPDHFGGSLDGTVAGLSWDVGSLLSQQSPIDQA